MVWKNFGNKKQKQTGRKVKKWFDERNKNLDDNWHGLDE